MTRPNLNPANPALALGAALLGAAVCALAPAAGAQANKTPAGGAGAPACDVNQSNPGSLGIAYLGIQGASSLTDTAAKFKALRGAVGRVSTDAAAAKQNPAGTAYTLAQALSLMSSDLRLDVSATRADLGFTTNPTQPADLLKTVDSLSTAVETAKPGCAPVMSQIRQNAWVTPVNAAIAALNAQKPDSAQLLAERALVVYKGSPLPYYVLGTVAQNKNDNAAAARYWPRVAELAQGDTSAQGQNLRSAALQNVALLAANAAQSAPAADRPARAKEADAAVQAFLTAYPNSPDAARMQNLRAQLAQLSGDKAALGSVYADQLANPGKYDDLALTNAGVIASQAGDQTGAAKLFEAALQKNPYQRDALNNLTATYYGQKQWAQIIPVGQRLIAVDPANPDNYLFLAYAYQGLAKAAPVGPQKKAYTDSLVKYSTLTNDMPLKVTFTEFTRGESRAVIGMNVEARKKDAAASTTTTGARRGAAAARPAAPAAAGPKSYTFAVEFLDKSGQVVDTQNVTVGPLATGESKATRVESPKGGVAAFRYKLAG